MGEIHDIINDTTAVLDAQGEILPNSDPLDELKCGTCRLKLFYDCFLGFLNIYLYCYR